MMLPVQSSMFSHIGYDADSMTLTVRYHPSKKQLAAEQEGDLWVYKNYTLGLPAEQPEDGWGRWFLANIRGKYEGEKVIPTDFDSMTEAGRAPESISITSTPINSTVQPVMPDNATFDRRDCGIGGEMEGW